MSAAEQRARPEAVVVHEVLEQPVSMRKRVVTGSLLVLTGAVTVLGWGLGSGRGDATFAFGGDTAVRLPDLTVPGTLTPVVLGALVVVLGLFQLVRGFRARRGPLLVGVAVAAFIVSFLCCAMSGVYAASIDVVLLLR